MLCQVKNLASISTISRVPASFSPPPCPPPFLSRPPIQNCWSLQALSPILQPTSRRERTSCPRFPSGARVQGQRWLVRLQKSSRISDEAVRACVLPRTHASTMEEFVSTHMQLHTATVLFLTRTCTHTHTHTHTHTRFALVNTHRLTPRLTSTGSALVFPFALFFALGGTCVCPCTPKPPHTPHPSPHWLPISDKSTSTRTPIRLEHHERSISCANFDL